jgi:hypothetical protein
LLDLFDAAFLIRNAFSWTWSLRGGRLHVVGSKASDIKLVLQREPCTGKTWYLGSFLHNEEHVDDVVRELLEELALH